jgi:hypothetical protein
MDKYHKPCPQCGEIMYRYSKKCFACSGKRHRTPEERLELRRAKNRRSYRRNIEKCYIKNHRYYEANKEKLKAKQREYNRRESRRINQRLKKLRAEHPEHFKAIADRYEAKRRNSEWYKQYQRNYRFKNRDEINKKRVAYFRTAKGHEYFVKRQLKHKQSKLLIQNKYYLLWTLNLPCEECGSYKRREIDHILERFNGGSDELDNLRVLCFKHHRQAGYGRHSTWRAGD